MTVATPPRNEYLTVKEIAEEYRISEETVRRSIRQGKLKAITFGRIKRVARKDLEDFLNKK